MLLSSQSLHTKSLLGALVLHSGIAAWALAPSDPIAIPQQQVIEVAFVSASQPVHQKESMQEKAFEAPPAPDGIALNSTKKLQKKAPEPKPEASKRSASGPQSRAAEAVNAALTDPLFDAHYLRNTPPAYPSDARRKGIQGTVLLSVRVSHEGMAETVHIERSSGSGILDEAARVAVTSWRFVPARRGGQSVAANVTVPIVFRIENRA